MIVSHTDDNLDGRTVQLRPVVLVGGHFSTTGNDRGLEVVSLQQGQQQVVVGYCTRTFAREYCNNVFQDRSLTIRSLVQPIIQPHLNSLVQGRYGGRLFEADFDGMGLDGLVVCVGSNDDDCVADALTVGTVVRFNFLHHHDTDEGVQAAIEVVDSDGTGNRVGYLPRQCVPIYRSALDNRIGVVTETYSNFPRAFVRRIHYRNKGVFQVRLSPIGATNTGAIAAAAAVAPLASALPPANLGSNNVLNF